MVNVVCLGSHLIELDSGSDRHRNNRDARLTVKPTKNEVLCFGQVNCPILNLIQGEGSQSKNMHVRLIRN